MARTVEVVEREQAAAYARKDDAAGLRLFRERMEVARSAQRKAWENGDSRFNVVYGTPTK